MGRALADLGLTPPQYAVLTMIDAYPGINGADLARLTQLTAPTINVIVRNLRRDGLIDAVAPGRGRSIGLHATAKGRRLRAQGRQRVTGVEAWLTDGLSAAEEKSVRSWLVRVAERGARLDPASV
jgi:DNA-binding MarR family transcriptional regulator